MEEVTTTENVGVEVPTNEPVANEVENTQSTSEEKTSTKSPRMFTESEVNKIVAERLARAKKNSARIETSSNTKADKSSNDDVLKKSLAEVQGQLAQYEKQLAFSKYQISEDYKDYVDYKVLHRVNKDISYADALKEFMEGEGKRFIETPQPVNQPRPKNSNTMESPKSDNDLRKLFGLKPKK